MKLKQLLAAALLTVSAGASAQTDVTSTYLKNADFSSTEGWTQEHPSQYWSLGNGLIGTYAVANNKTSTTDGTHLATEYCLGIQCRWSTNYAAFTQTTSELPAGVYTLTYDVQNTNASTKATYENRFKVTVGSNTYSDSKTEWMNGKSAWTTHTIKFTLTEASAATFSFGYGTSDNNFGTGATPHLYVSHLNLTWADPLQDAKAALQAEINKAKLCDAKEGLTSAISTAESVLSSATAITELEDALAALQAADKDAVLRYENGLADATASEPVTTSFVVNGTFDSGINGWSRTGTFQNNKTANNQAGAFTGNFYENWNGSAQANKMYQVLENIPNGTYRLDIAAFVNTLADPNESQFVFANSDKVYLTAGEPTAYEVYTVVTNNTIEIGLEQTTATANWMGIDNVSLRYYGAGDVIEEAKAGAPFIAAKDALQATIDAAPSVLTTNIGDGVFQLAKSGVDTYADALAAAQAALNATDATIASLEAAKTTFEAAIAAYQALELNAPADGQLFNVVLTFAGWTYDQKAMTFIANGRTDAGNYNIQYKEAANTNLAQAFTFTKVEGNKYKMSQIDADGVVRYISTGVPYSGNANQIRTVTEADKALLIEVIPTNVEGVYNLRNTEANNYIGSQDAGVYTVNSHIDFALVETTKPSIAINTTAAGWGTVMLPFAVASLPAEVKAYSCAEVDGNTLTLVEATALEANKPYIIEGAWNETLTGDAQGIDMTYTAGLLTGTYAQVAAPNGSYILQKQDEKVGFYQVDTEVAQPNVPANHAYLTKDDGSAVKAFFLGGGEDAIQSVFDGVAAGEIYNVAGQRINKLQRGVNIVNGKKVVIK